MTDTRALIENLVAEAKPVRPLPYPLLRAGLWLAVALGILVLLGADHGVRPDLAAQLARPSFRLGLGASLLTGVLAACGSLIASLPDRSRLWLLLPVPSLLLWLSTIGYGCLTDWVEFDAGSMQMGETLRCFATLLLVSLPLSIVMFAMLRHVARLRPAAVTLTAALAVAAMTSTAMALFHALDATILILIWNLGTAVLIVALEATMGARLLAWFARVAA